MEKHKPKSRTNLYSISEYARLMNVSRRTIYNWIENGDSDFEIVRVGSSRRVKLSDAKIAEMSEVEIERKTSLSLLSLSDLASLCVIYKMNNSDAGQAKIISIEKEIDRRLNNVFA